MAPSPNDEVRKVLRIGRSKGRHVLKWLAVVLVSVVVVLATTKVLRRRAAALAPQYVTEPVRRSDVNVTISATGNIQGLDRGQTLTVGFQTPVLFHVGEDLKKLSLRVDVDEADIGRVREGNAATFSVDAYPQRTFSSKVLSLQNEPKTTQSVVFYEAVLAVDNADRLLRPGMTATATIISETIQATLVIPNAALRFTPPILPGVLPPAPPKGGEQRVYVLRAGVPTPLSLKIGASDGHVTQIVSAELAAGSEVLVDVVLSH